MIAYHRGDVILVEFVFADESGAKVRPALVISSQTYHRSRPEVIVAAITSNVARRLSGDHPIVEWESAGLVLPSTVTGIIRTIDRSAIRRTLGSLAKTDLDAFDEALRVALDL